jgi:hypothetical protein
MSSVGDELVVRTVEQLHWEVRLRADGIVWLRRRAQPYASIEAIDASYNAFLKVVDDWLFERRIKSGHIGTKRRTPMAWLTDIRGAPDLRNDAQFERVVRSRRPDLLERSPILGILVNSAAGEMQLNRITRDGGAVIGVFSEPTDIVAWLLARMKDSLDR